VVGLLLAWWDGVLFDWWVRLFVGRLVDKLVDLFLGWLGE
jgi:hypothetical protein